ncbi:flagellar basal body rod protein FlgC [Xylophilus rhododendri]|uniref:Flagellar basal body rod protein FlgC n=1 Tax=Xylophilus rhododendri TaxID=2697032 RepID=A0A857J8S8_9BURK|nr:flagellar basal body rod C-terminal domain-containing protein [Xylophilus rhododendri]QHI99168.1 flagellar basal body rod protein FlgC [Xylophilus rhododendri]
MPYSQTFAISAAGMDLERTRIEVATLNLANLHTIQMPDGSRFEPLQVSARSVAPAPQPGFASRIADGLDEWPSMQSAFPLPQAAVLPAGTAPRRVHEPANPFADAQGFVSYPGTDTAREMLTMMDALRAYEANVVAMNTAKVLALKALEIGGSA